MVLLRVLPFDGLGLLGGDIGSFYFVCFFVSCDEFASCTAWESISPVCSWW